MAVDRPALLKHVLLVCAGLLFLGMLRVNAQEPTPPPGWDDWLLQLDDQTSGELTEQQLEEHQQASMFQRIQKINLNSVDRQDLQESGLFTQAEIEALLAHRARFGALLAWYELQAIPGFSPSRLAELRVACEVRPGHQRDSWKNSWRSARHSWLSRSDYSWPRAEGYHASRAAQGMSHYSGSPLGQRIQYRQQGLMHKAVLTVAREPGEMGWDRLGGHLQFRSNGRLQRLVLGDYHLQWGEGLVANTGFGALRATTLDGFHFPGLQLTGASGAQSFGTYRGAIAQWKLAKQLLWVPWLFRMSWSSTQQLISDDTPTFSSIQRSGLHRTPTERSNRHNLPVWGWGTAWHYQHKQLQWIAGVQQFYLTVAPSSQQPTYRQLQPQEQSRWHLSLSHCYNFHRLQWQGEWAWQPAGGSALVQQVYGQLPGRVQLRLAYRHLTPHYHSYLANSIQRGSEVSNEKGWLINVQHQVNSRLGWAVLVDVYEYPWLRYRLSSPSTGIEQRWFLQWFVSKHRQISWQTRIESFERSQSASIWSQNQTLQRLRHQLQYREQFNDHWDCYWLWGFNLFATPLAEDNQAQMLAFKLRYQEKKWRIAAQFTLFDAPLFDNRFFITEPDVLYGAGMAQLSGTGQRWVLQAQYKHRRADVWVRYARLQMTDREQLGAGLDELPDNLRHQLRLQIQWKHAGK